MNFLLDESWKRQLQNEFQQPYFHDLDAFLDDEYASSTCFPREDDIFAAFNHCSFDATKVILIGQDPYHGLGQANGLCFSVKDGISHPPSLRNIFKEIENDLQVPYPKSGNLKRWAQQGVLLLNATLTVRAHEAGSHQKKGWEKFTNTVISKLSDEKEDLVFLLWGGFAKKKSQLIDASKHHILTSGHPSPLSANRGYWFGNKHFSKTNTILKKANNFSIVW
ncbi:MAG: uracil-DNA glycosylase [Maribacter sp.]